MSPKKKPGARASAAPQEPSARTTAPELSKKLAGLTRFARSTSTPRARAPSAAEREDTCHRCQRDMRTLERCAGCMLPASRCICTPLSQLAEQLAMARGAAPHRHAPYHCTVCGPLFVNLYGARRHARALGQAHHVARTLHEMGTISAAGLGTLCGLLPVELEPGNIGLALEVNCWGCRVAPYRRAGWEVELRRDAHGMVSASHPERAGLAALRAGSVEVLIAGMVSLTPAPVVSSLGSRCRATVCACAGYEPIGDPGDDTEACLLCGHDGLRHGRQVPRG